MNTMRQKKPTEVVIEKTISFLQDLQDNYLPRSPHYLKNSIPAIQKANKVSKSNGTACKALLILKKDEAGPGIIWNSDFTPNRKTALLLLDYNLRKTKKTVHEPIPEFAAVVTAVTGLTERLGVYITQNEKRSKGLKIGDNETTEKHTLFSNSERRFEMVASIAGHILVAGDRLGDISSLAKVIVGFADEILLELDKPTGPVIKKVEPEIESHATI